MDQNEREAGSSLPAAEHSPDACNNAASAEHGGPADTEPQVGAPAEGGTQAAAVEEAIRLLAAAIKGHFDCADAAARSAVLERFDGGTLVQAAMSDEQKYGKKLVDSLSEKTGLSTSWLYDSARVARTWSRAEVEELVTTDQATWSVLVELSAAKQKDVGEKLLAAWKTEDLGVRELKERRKVLEAAAENEGDAETEDKDEAEPEDELEDELDKVRKKCLREAHRDTDAAHRHFAALFRLMEKPNASRPEEYVRLIREIMERASGMLRLADKLLELGYPVRRSPLVGEPSEVSPPEIEAPRSAADGATPEVPIEGSRSIDKLSAAARTVEAKEQSAGSIEAASKTAT